MDDRVKKAVLDKIDETLASADEIREIRKRLASVVSNDIEFVFGIAIGRIYNSFYYQTRRMLKRNPTEQEFKEFLEILDKHAKDIRQVFLQ
jgi:hypothetical protein